MSLNDDVSLPAAHGEQDYVRGVTLDEADGELATSLEIHSRQACGCEWAHHVDGPHRDT